MTQAVTKRYNIEPDQLRVYIHYQPSYYHLHVHFVHVKYDAGMGMAVGKAHFLDGIIGEIDALSALIVGSAALAPCF